MYTSFPTLPLPDALPLYSVNVVRPAHRLIALGGNDVIKVSTLGLQAGRDTLGHRFMAGQIISIATPESYESQLHQEGKVIASFPERRALIDRQMQEQALALGDTIGAGAEVDAHLEEVNALVAHRSEEQTSELQSRM